jgi:outer membrane biosynthesis protein TonB
MGVLLVTGAACSARRQAAVLPAQPEREGVTSVRVLTDPTASAAPDITAERVTAAQASDQNQLPVYPAYALKSGCQGGSVPVRVHIGTDGNVSAVRSIPNHPIADDQCHSAFWVAVYNAVSTWKFAPAFRQTPYPGPDVDGDGKSDVMRWKQEAVAIYVDFEFMFRVVDGKGEVRTH